MCVFLFFWTAVLRVDVAVRWGQGAIEMKSQLERHMDVLGSEHGHTAHGSGSKCTHNCAIGRRHGEALHRVRSEAQDGALSRCFK